MKKRVQRFARAVSTNAIFILICILLVTELLSINWYFQAMCVILGILCIVILAFQKSRVYSLRDNDAVNQRQRDEMLMYFSREYFEVYVVDLNQGSYEIVRSSERHGDYIKNLTGDFGQIEFIYKSYDEKWKRLECFPVPDYGNDNKKMIFALRDYTDEMQIRTNEVLATEAMNDIYTLVAFRDMEADRYECGYHRMENVLDFPDKGIYSDWVKLMLKSIHEKDREKFLTELSDERFHREGRAECEYRIRDKDGEYHYYRQYNAKVNVLSGPKMVILIRNIDEFKKHEIWKAEQLQRELEAKAKELEMTRLLAEKSKDLEKALQQAESANNAKSKFLSTMSHDLRTPMNVILGMAYMARKHIDDEAEVDRCLNTILLSSQNMLALINDVLDMNKIESGVIEVREKKEDLVKLISDIEVLIRNRCEENQQIFTVDCRRVTHKYMWLDKLRVRQIIINLLSNAVKYTPAFGRISMEVIEQPGKNEAQCSVAFIEWTDQSRQYDQCGHEGHSDPSVHEM